jgi:monooxygenase
MAVSKQVDVLIVGAGISGIDAAYRLKTRCPGKSWAILEARDRIGGTWDLFRYPGVRSDSDIFTLGFPFRPWPSDKCIVEGPAIRDYLEDTAREFGIFDHIRFAHRVLRANWSSKDAAWSVEVEHCGRREQYVCAYLFMCSGYYDYAQGHRPTWPGEAEFEGCIIHPQFWPDDLNVAGKRVAVIGSGATAVTLVPSLAKDGAQVTMVQRSPSYVVARPSRDRIAAGLQRILPPRAAHAVTRWKNLLLGIYFFRQARRKPEKVAHSMREQVRMALPAGYPIERHFTPAYKPWDQRLCLIPDGDLFEAIAASKVSVATGGIDRFTSEGLRLASGETVAVDIVVAATGLQMKLLGGAKLVVDGQPVRLAEHHVYKGMMLSGVPNLFLAFGYTNASWTLRSDLTARAVCRLINRMDRKRFKVCIARAAVDLEPHPIMELNSGYVKRAASELPSQGDRGPWRVPQNYVRDLARMTFSRIDEALEFDPQQP